MQVGKDLSLLSGVSEEQIRTEIDRYTSNLSDRNIDRVYDELSSDEIDTIFKSIEKTKETSNDKSGLEDSILNSELQKLSSKTAISEFNDMTQNIKSTQELNKQEQTLGDTEANKEYEGWDINDD